MDTCFSRIRTSGLLILFLVGSIQLSRAQTAPQIVWQRCLGSSYGDGFNSIARAHDGGYVLAGYTSGPNDGDVSGIHPSAHGITNGKDYWVVKVNSAGTMQWQHCLGGSRDDAASSIIATADGGYAVVGYACSSDGDITSDHGGLKGPSNRLADIWVIKLDSVGSIEWQHTLGGAGYDAAHQILQTTDGGYVVIGETTSTGDQVSNFHMDPYPNDGDLGTDVWVVKLDSIGGIVWESAYGGSRIDAGYSIVETGDHGFVFAAFSASSDGDLRDSSINGTGWIVKLDINGSIRWQRRIGGTNYDYPYAIINADDGGFAITGSRASTDELLPNHGSTDVWVVRLDSIGKPLWQNSLGGGSTDNGNAIVQTVDHGFTIAGSTNSANGDITRRHPSWWSAADVWLLHVDSDGILNWQQCLGGSQSEGAYGIVLDADGTITIAGATGSTDGDAAGTHDHSEDEAGTVTNADGWIVHLK